MQSQYRNVDHNESIEDWPPWETYINSHPPILSLSFVYSCNKIPKCLRFLIPAVTSVHTQNHNTCHK